MKALFASFLLLIALVAVPAPAQAAFDIFKGGDCGNGNTQDSAVCSADTTNNPISGENGILLKVTRLVAFVGGIAAIIIMLVGSLKYITSGGDPQKAGSAKSTIVNGLIGLAVIVLAASLISFVVSRL